MLFVELIHFKGIVSRFIVKKIIWIKKNYRFLKIKQWIFKKSGKGNLREHKNLVYINFYSIFNGIK